ncbi:MAG TPA: 3-hydroxyacyl-CoA dehydrogenase NAD-binding domain-containing protein [Acetobacteraceae bacterium]|nr:3-hydroxyacyl-CoA dehydrogenase NAD-binding domain-containing protein [Acetobacteraceae bacterium]
MSTRYDVHGRVAVIAMHNPPVNGLGHALRSGIVEGVRRAEADPAVAAIVLIGTDRAFSGGADIREFNTPLASAEPNLNTVIYHIETARKPVIAAISGVAMGGGLELALGCHFRVVRPGTQIALPEVKLGILPGAGGTQRLPRVVGAETALNMIVSGAPVPSEALKQTKLFDSFIEGDLLEGALAFADMVVAEQRPLRLVRDLPVELPKAEAFFLFAQNGIQAASKNYPAPLKCLEAVRASVEQDFDAGFKVERDAFTYLVNTDESKALRHVFFAERAASKIPDVPETTPVREIRKVGVIGAGTMGSGIAINFLNAGIPVTLLETSQAALDRGLAGIARIYADNVAKGRLKPEKAEATKALLTPTLSYDDLGDADLVIEAVFEEMGVKEAVFGKLDQVCKPGAILASNTSTLNIDRIASFTARPQDVIGLHFFSPANIMKLLEVVRGAQTGKDVLATAMRLAKTIRKTAVVAGVCDGFIGNRMINAYGYQAQLMLEEGASPAQIDGAIERFGFAMGPMRMNDLAGGDIGWAIRKRHYAEDPQSHRLIIADRLCELGRFGQKTGAGYYRYVKGNREALHDPVVDEVIAAGRAELGIVPRTISDREIVGRCIYALVNEAAHILEEGIALRASDIDLVYLTGYGFPAYRGGPLFYADQVGLMNVIRTMEGFAARGGVDAAFWQPAPLLARLAAEGKTFN